MNHVLSMLLGPQSLDIQVKDPKKYSFDPIKLLKKVAGIMGNMSWIEQFITFVVNDGKFSKDVIKWVMNSLKKNRLYDECDLWEGF